MEITFLGTGTSDGVPMIGCCCSVCKSKDKRDKRLRSSLLIKNDIKNYIIDTSLDFREQMLREKIRHIDKVFYTHSHADHIAGIVDLRSINCAMDGKVIKCYGNKETIEELKIKYDFFFNPPQKGGGLPLTNFEIIEKAIHIDGIKITPLKVWHGILPILGYKFNEKFAYITDASKLEADTLKEIKGIDTLVINCLRYRPHSTHLSAQEVVDIVLSLGIKKVYLTHMTHDIGHRKFTKDLPKNIKPAYDGMKIYF